MSQTRRIALLIETSRAYGRGLVRGAARYHREIGHWSVYFQPHGLDDPPPEWLATWEGDGILARVGSCEVAEAVCAVGVPVVELRGMLTDLDIPFIGVDNAAVGGLALEHLRERGFQHFGFCGMPRHAQPCMDERSDFFSTFVAEAGCVCDVYQARKVERAVPWEEEQEAIAKWLKALPKPVGVMTCNDDRGLQVLDACRRARVAVPDEVAVISVDNDDYLCGLSIPPLTSIDVLPDRIGFEAAAMLDRMMDGEQAPQGPTLIPPRRVVTRESTDVLATDDREVAMAVSFIRQHACERIQVGDVLRHVRLSRTVLEPRFKQLLGRTIHQETQRVQVERVKELLALTDLPIKQIASRCGFTYTQYMTRVFREAVGKTPAQYRKAVAE